MLNKKKTRHLKESIFLLLNISFAFCVTLNIGLSLDLRYDPPDFNIYDLPVTSAQEIVIRTPQNKSYVGPIAGHYPGTHSFENDADGSNPAGFNVHEGAGYVNVIATKGGHSKVVEMYDGVNDDHTELHNVFQPQTSGTIEFWILNEDVSDTFSIILLDDVATSVWGSSLGWIQIWQDNLRYEDNVDWHDTTKAISDNAWYHLKIEFECTTGNYKGLAQGTYRFYVDGELFGDYTFHDDISNISQIYFATRGTDNSYKCFVDALAFSWEPNYNIGDNQYDGLLISFENSTRLNWIGYSLDNQANITITGNTSITSPPVGLHTIQLFGTDLNATIYESDLIYFTIGEVEIPNPPPNIPFDFQIIIIGVSVGFLIIFISVFYLYRRKRKLPAHERHEKESSESLGSEQIRNMREFEKQKRIERERQKRKDEDTAVIEKIRKVMSVSTRLKMELLRNYLKIDEKLFNDKIFDWAEQFGFTIDGDYINIRKEKVSDFIDELEKQFEGWRKFEDDRLDKI